MVDQKGFDLIAALADELAALDASFVVLGTGEARYQDLWRELAARHPDRIGARIGFDEALAHLIEGGRRHLPDAVAVRAVRAESDVQPAVRHGAGRAGGRRPRRHGARLRGRRVGRDRLRVRRIHAGGAARGPCAGRWRSSAIRPRWRALQLAGMRQDHSWDRSAREYVKIYERAMNRGPRLDAGRLCRSPRRRLTQGFVRR